MGIDLGVAAFWIALAGVIIAGNWSRSRSEALKHETLRQIVEKTGQIDEEQLRMLFNPPPPAWLLQPEPGGAYRALRILGTLALFVSVGLAIFFMAVWLTGAEPRNTAVIGLAITSVIALFGVGLIFSSRYVPRPRSDVRREHQAP